VRPNLLPHVPEEVSLRSRPVGGWRLDAGTAVRAVGTYASHVRVVRLDVSGAAPRPGPTGR